MDEIFQEIEGNVASVFIDELEKKDKIIKKLREYIENNTDCNIDELINDLINT